MMPSMWLVLLSALRAAPLELPPGQDAALWSSAAAHAGLELGAASACPWVRLEAGPSWTVQACDREGALRSARRPPPRDEADREDLLSLGVSLMEPVVVAWEDPLAEWVAVVEPAVELGGGTGGGGTVGRGGGGGGGALADAVRAGDHEAVAERDSDHEAVAESDSDGGSDSDSEADSEAEADSVADSEARIAAAARGGDPAGAPRAAEREGLGELGDDVDLLFEDPDDEALSEADLAVALAAGLPADARAATEPRDLAALEALDAPVVEPKGPVLPSLWLRGTLGLARHGGLRATPALHLELGAYQAQRLFWGLAAHLDAPTPLLDQDLPRAVTTQSLGGALGLHLYAGGEAQLSLLAVRRAYTQEGLAVGVTRLPQAQLTLGWEIPLAGDRPERRPLLWIGLDASLDLAATELSVDGVSIGDLPLWSLGLRAGASLPRPTISCLR
ncbi:MAG: hypothetical protein H6741_03085 [Alphaproteobacteria bacterium]|nr:hypothetical protein [Alphaproteobacteria bacterium]